MISAQRFFDEELPRLLEGGAARAKRDGEVLFEVSGEEGGRWRISLRAICEIAPEDQSADADLVIRMSHSAFEPFVDGSLDVEEAVASGDLLLAGDLALLDELASMWHAPMSPVGVRARGSRR